MKILAVDDDPLVLELLEETLKEGGYECLSLAPDAETAAEMIANAEEPFDCFLLDIMMPGVNGIDLCRWIRKLPDYRTAPILMITSMGEKQYVDGAFLAGASDYVTKPFDETEVLTRINVAKRQLDANRQVAASQREIKTLTARMNDTQRVPLAEPVMLDDVDRLIELNALENYLLQMSRGTFSGTSVFAVGIADVVATYERCTGPIFRDILADIAECTLTVFRGEACILAYTGNGVFVGAMENAKSLDFDEAEVMINMMIEELGLVDAATQPLDVRVILGDPRLVGLGAFKSGRLAPRIIGRVVEDMTWKLRLQAAPAARAKKSAKDMFSSLAQRFE